ncbi:MAG TPA: SDR family oxidoreductase [Anaerolineae bacterium]|nr:SDR family oxidoreductase [Anaerolineae bacterium]
MRALITGAGGFVGGHLCAYLLAHTDWDLVGTVYPGPVGNPQPSPRLRHVQADLRDLRRVTDLVEQFESDFVFHLAAQSSIPSSFANPWGTLENNIRSQLNLLEAVRRLGRPARVVVIGSNEEYGSPDPEDLPLAEESPLRPTNPYAVSKVAQDFLGLQYHLAYGMEVVRLRPFNHTGPGQSPRFVVAAFASQIARIEAGLQEPVVRVGNLDVARDFTDVRDIVRAYHLAATQAEAGEVYNLASGRPQSVRGLLETLLSLSTVEIRAEVDPTRYRPTDTPVVYGSAKKFCRRTGWEPEIPFEQTLRDVLEYWRGQVCR